MNIQNLFSTLKAFPGGNLPGQLVIQYSNRCNADCPQCGMRRTADIQRYTLSKDKVKCLIDDAARNNVQSLSLTGGEPLLFLDDIIELINYADAAGIPFIRTGTNGFIFRNSHQRNFTDRITTVAERLAGTNIYSFWISLDSSVAEDHEQIRALPGVVKGIEKALPIFHEHGIYPAVNLGINRALGGFTNQPFLEEHTPESFLEACRNALHRFYTTACNLGFTTANACYPMSSGEESATTVHHSVYGALSSNALITFSPEEKVLLFTALFETIPHFRGRLRIFSPLCTLYSLIKKFRDQQAPLFPCRGGRDFFFAECENGRIHPCGYRDEWFERLPGKSKERSAATACDRCEWECFRDPSDLLGPFAELFTHPLRLCRKIARDPLFFRLLYRDLRYYRACQFFNCRMAPNYKVLRDFGGTREKHRHLTGTSTATSLHRQVPPLPHLTGPKEAKGQHTC